MVGQVEAKWAVEVAAAGRHHMFFHGPPGVGKTMLAERVPGLLPDLDLQEALEVSAVHSLAGFNLADGLIVRPPYSDPHHSASVASIVGGGPRLAKPGAISCAHQGILFLDEAPEFSPKVIEALRTPLEAGSITLGRSEAQARYPAKFQLIMAANPCPCGQAATPGAHCQCPPMAVRRYADKISGPIRDRIDISQGFLPMRKAHLRAALERTEASAAVAGRVGGPGAAAAAARRDGLADQRRGLRPLPAAPSGPAGRPADRRRRLQPGPAEPAGGGQGAAGGLDAGRPGRAGPARRRRGGGRAGDAARRATRHRTGGGVMTQTERAARMALSCAMDGGDPAVVELVKRLGAAGAWRRILEGALGEPAARRAAGTQVDLAVRLAQQARARFVVPGDEEWPSAVDDLARAGRSSVAAGCRSGCGCAGRVTWSS